MENQKQSNKLLNSASKVVLLSLTLGLLILVCISLFLYVFFELSENVLVMIITLFANSIGLVYGFYFNSKENSKDLNKNENKTS